MTIAGGCGTTSITNETKRQMHEKNNAFNHKCDNESIQRPVNNNSNRSKSMYLLSTYMYMQILYSNKKNTLL